jgi:hypothetical protein
VLEAAQRVALAQHVHARGELHAPRQLFVEVQPRLVPLGDRQLLHPAEREHGDVPLHELIAQLAHQPDGVAVPRAVAARVLGERQ